MLAPARVACALGGMCACVYICEYIIQRARLAMQGSLRFVRDRRRFRCFSTSLESNRAHSPSEHTYTRSRTNTQAHKKCAYIPRTGRQKSSYLENVQVDTASVICPILAISGNSCVMYGLHTKTENIYFIKIVLKLNKT